MYYKIEQLKNILASHRNCVFGLDKLCESALEYIQHLESGIDRCYELAKQVEAAQPKWISVEERLPEPDKNVLTLKNRKRVRIGYYSEDCEEWVINDMIAYDEDITHWMPLPPAPDETTTPKEAD